MTLLKGFARPGAVTALFAVLLSLGLVIGSATTHAQQPPFRAYGTGLSAGDTVTASVNGVDCGSATADSGGNWLLDITADAACAPTTGDTIDFALNGSAVSETASWESGGSPVSSGYTAASGIASASGGLTASGAAAPAPAAPAPPDTGNAGMAMATGTSLWLVLGMGVFALALLAGARTVTRPSLKD